jgi:hypothetical protein
LSKCRTRAGADHPLVSEKLGWSAGVRRGGGSADADIERIAPDPGVRYVVDAGAAGVGPCGRLGVLIAGHLALIAAPKSVFYKNRRPTRAGRRSTAWTWLAGAVSRRTPGGNCGGTIALETRARSGAVREHVVTWVDVDGARYLVSMLGERSDWGATRMEEAWVRHGGRKPAASKSRPARAHPQGLPEARTDPGAPGRLAVDAPPEGSAHAPIPGVPHRRCCTLTSRRMGRANRLFGLGRRAERRIES